MTRNLKHAREAKCSCRLVLHVLACLLFFAGANVVAQEHKASASDARSSAKSQPHHSEAESGQQSGTSAELAKASREAAGEDETAEFKRSPSVKFLAKITGMSLEHAYWLGVLVNFAVVAGVIFWFAKKNLPAMFRSRTASIQNALEEARKTSQEAKTDAGAFQLNVNAPINLLTNESGNGEVTQSNDAKTIAKSENSNDTWQSNRQNQDGSQVSKGHGCGDDHGRDQGHDGLGKDGKVGGEGGFSQSQEATNNNQTDQDADAYANTRQKNVNVPVNFLTNDSGNGDVRQRNDAKTVAKSENENQTDQSNRQSQQGFSSHKGSCGCRKHDGHKRGEGRHGLIPLWPVAAVEPLPLSGWPLVALGGFLLTGGLTLRRRSA